MLREHLKTAVTTMTQEDQKYSLDQSRYTCKSCRHLQPQKLHQQWKNSTHTYWNISPARVWSMAVLMFLIVLPLCAGEDLVFVLPLRHGHHLHEDNARHRRSLSKGDLGGTPGQGYYIQMGVGTPQQMFNVLIDTGSSNFALAAAPHVDIEHFFNSSSSSTFEDIGTEVYVPYTKGDWHGYLGRDEVTIVALPNVTISVDFALIDEASEFYIDGSDWQGILGMGYAEIARPDDSVVPFFDALIEQKEMKAVFSMELCGLMETEDGEMSMGGSLVLGGTEKSLYNGDIMYGKLHKEWYYEVIMTDIKVAGRSVDMPCKEYNFDKTIVDSGTTNFRLPIKVYDAVTTKISQHTNEFWTGEDILCWPTNLVPWDMFPQLGITIAHSENTTFELLVSPRQYLRPVQDSDDVADETCYKYAIVPSETGAVIGAVIMEGYYVVFDKENKQIGFAENTCSNRGSDEFNSKITDYKLVTYNTTLCAYYKLDTDRSSLLMVGYVLAGICGLCLLLLLVMVLQWQVATCYRRYQYPAEATSSTQLIE